MEEKEEKKEQEEKKEKEWNMPIDDLHIKHKHCSANNKY